MTVSILLSIRNNIITLLNVLSIEKVNERSSSCYKTTQRSKLFWATHNRMVNDNDIKISFDICKKYTSRLNSFKIINWRIKITTQPFDYKFYKQICFKSQFVDLMEKTFFVLQYKVNGIAEIFCKNVKVKGHNQSQDVLLVDIWKLQ